MLPVATAASRSASERVGSDSKTETECDGAREPAAESIAALMSENHCFASTSFSAIHV